VARPAGADLITGVVAFVGSITAFTGYLVQQNFDCNGSPPRPDGLNPSVSAPGSTSQHRPDAPLARPAAATGARVLVMLHVLLVRHRGWSAA
jgi:hypothetical protein